MLVLTRKLGQSITVGDDIQVTVLAVEGDRVSLGVEAPRSVRIFRSELLTETKEVNREAAGSKVICLKEIVRKEG